MPRCTRYAGIICLCCVMAVLSPAIRSSGDIVETTDGKILKGVIVEQSDNRVVVSTTGGDKVLKREDVSGIEKASWKENMLLLAGIARDRGDNAKAYYLYEKILKQDPEEEEAVAGLRELDPYLLKDPLDDKWVSDYQRYQSGSAAETGEKEVLLSNSEQTEKIEKDLGVILAEDDGRTKVTYVSPDSKAYGGGLEINDIITNVNGRPAEYLGLFDIVTLMAGHGGAAVTVRRETRLWVDEKSEVLKYPLWDVMGVSISSAGGRAVFTDVKPGSYAYQAGIRPGDGIVSMNNREITGPSAAEEAEKVLRATGPGYVDLVVSRHITF